MKQKNEIISGLQGEIALLKMQIAHLESTDARGVDVESLVAAREASAYRENEALTRQREAEAQRDEAMIMAKGLMEDAEEYQAQMEKVRGEMEKVNEGIRAKIKEVELSLTQDCAEVTRHLNEALEQARAKDACIADLHRELDEVRAAAKRDVAAAEERANEAAQDLKRMMDTTLNDNVEQALVLRAANTATNALQAELRAAQAAQTVHLKQIHALKCEGELLDKTGQGERRRALEGRRGARRAEEEARGGAEALGVVRAGARARVRVCGVGFRRCSASESLTNIPQIDSTRAHAPCAPTGEFWHASDEGGARGTCVSEHRHVRKLASGCVGGHKSFPGK